MDDDAVPDPDALECMTKHRLFNDIKTGILTPVIYDVNGLVQKYHHKILSPLLNERPFISTDNISRADVAELKDFFRLDANSFVGPLISRAAIDKVQFPLAEFFILCDDLEYTYRISRHFNIYLITSAGILHNDFYKLVARKGRVRVPFNSYWRTYYTVRNMIAFKQKHLPRRYKPVYALQLCLNFIKKAAAVFFYDDKKTNRLKILLLAYMDGALGNFQRKVKV